MSLRYEQYHALKKTREFLREILTLRGRVRITELRARAYSCLRHFPHLYDNGRPIWSRDSFTKD